MIFTKLFATIIRSFLVLGTLYAVGVCTYFTIQLSKRDELVGRMIAVEAISAAAFLWACFALLFTVCFLQKSFFQWLTILMDLIFVGGFVAIVVLIRDIWGSDCNRDGEALPWLEHGGRNFTANCQLGKGLFIVGIVLAGLFAICLIVALLAHRSTKKDRAYGPSPANNYTSGRGRKHHGDTEAAVIAGPAVAPPVDHSRRSLDSKYTDITEKTNDGMGIATTTTGPGREYLAPRPVYSGTERTVSPAASSINLRSDAGHSHTGQYAAAGVLAGGAAAHHYHNQHGYNAYGTPNDSLPNHPGPEDGTREHVPVVSSNLRPIPFSSDSHTDTMYSELDNTTTTGGSTFMTGPHNPRYVEPRSFYPAVTHPGTQELSSSALHDNPHFYSHEMDTTMPGSFPQELGTTPNRHPGEYMAPGLPDTPDIDRDEAGFGYANGPGLAGQTGSNQVSTLPEYGHIDSRKF